MTWYEISVTWEQVKARVHEKWTKLTENDLASIAGRRDRFVRALQEKCGYAKEQAERELDDFARRLVPVPVAEQSRQPVPPTPDVAR
jgi:uncharacterized protein YjbJ (UPF0337 family)